MGRWTISILRLSILSATLATSPQAGVFFEQRNEVSVDHDGADEGELVRVVEAKGGYKAKVVR